MDRLPSEIVTPRLVLRLWRPEDVAAVHDAIEASLEHLRPWLVWTRLEPLTVEQRLDLVRSGRVAWQDGGDANYGAFRDGLVVGACGLRHREGPSTLDLGYWVHVDHVGQGYSTEMARGLTSAAFGVPGIERVEIHHDRANERSGAVPRSLGFTQGAERPDGVHASGEVGIDCTWWVDRSDWDVGERRRVPRS